MKTMDITEDDERDLETDDETENQEGEEGEEQQTRSRKTASSAAAAVELRELKNQVAQLTIAAQSKGTKQDEQQVSRLEATMQKLIKDGYKPEQLTALLEVAQALTDDIRGETKAVTEQEKKQEFYQRCWKRVYDALDVIAEKNDVSAEAFAYVRDDLAKRVAKTMETHEKFGDARSAYAQRIEPDKSNFSTAARMVFETYRKETGMKQPDNTRPAQLDLQSSRSKAAPSTSKDKEIDLGKLSDFEKEVYLSTKNITKNEALARKALDRVRGR